MVKPSELKVITDTKRLIDYIFTILEKSPKKYRYTFTTKIQNICFEIIELFYEANFIKLGNELRFEKQELIMVKFKLLDYYCDLAFKNQCILFKQLEQISKQINNCMKLHNTWIASDKRRLQG